MLRPIGIGDFIFILLAVRWTIALSLMAFLGGGVVGLGVALARVSRRRWVRSASAWFIRVIQGTPLLTQIFLVFFGAAMLGWDIGAMLAAAACLTINTAGFLGEIWRGCIEAIPAGQWQAAEALGLRRMQVLRHVVLPQAARLSIPPTVGCLVHVIKGTSLAALIGFVELSRAGQIVNNSTYDPMLVFGTVGALYFALCWPISRLSARLERRLAAG